MRFAEWLGDARRCCRPSPRCASTATEIVDQVLAENAGRWECASPRDLARVEAIARAVMNRLLHEPTIRLRTLAEQQRPRPPAARCASCSGSTTAPRGRRRSRRPAADVRPLRAATRVRIGTRGSALALAQAELAVAGARRRGIETRPDHRRPATAAAPRPTRSAGSRELERRAAAPARSTSPCTPPRTSRRAARGPRARRARRRARTRATRSAAPRRSTRCRDGARVGTASLRRAAQLRARRAGPRGRRAARQRRHAPAHARRAATSTRSCSPPPGWSGSGAAREVGALLTDARARPRPGTSRLRGPRRRRRRRATPRSRVTDAATGPRCAASARSCAALDADCHTPVGAYAVPDGDR